VAGALTRRGVLRGIGAIGIGVLAERAGLLRTAARQSDALQDTIDAAITAEALAVTFLGVARQRGASDDLPLGVELVDFLRAAQCEEEAHFHFLEAAGARPTTTAFTFPEAIFADIPALLRTIVDVETVFVGTYMAAVRQLAATGDLDLVEVAFQIGAVEAQHQALARHALGARPAGDRAFAQWLYRDVAEASQSLVDLGFIGGPGDPVAYPGPVDRYCRGVFGLVPQTTSAALADPLLASPEATPT
jgi:hypothetical protein